MDHIEPGTPIPTVPLVTKTPPGTGQHQRRQKGEEGGKPKKEEPSSSKEGTKERPEESASSEPEASEPKGTHVDIQV